MNIGSPWIISCQASWTSTLVRLPCVLNSCDWFVSIYSNKKLPIWLFSTWWWRRVDGQTMLIVGVALCKLRFRWCSSGPIMTSTDLRFHTRISDEFGHNIPALLWRLMLQIDCMRWLRLLQAHQIIQRSARMDTKTSISGPQELIERRIHKVLRLSFFPYCRYWEYWI